MKYWNYYLEAFARAFDFKGRASRMQYWSFVLVTFLIYVVLFVLMGLAGDSWLAGLLSVFIMLYYLVLIIPSIALSIRRMHDINYNGWWLLISLVPIIGGIWFFVLTVLPSQNTNNRFGN